MGMNVEEEIQNLQRVDHPHIIRLIEYYEDYNDLFIIMEIASGDDFQKLMEEPPPGGITETFLAVCFKQSMEAVTYCHQNRMIHKDLKGPNIMFATPDRTPQGVHVKIVDLGMCEIFTPECPSRAAGGTPGFMAPEVWASALGESTFGAKCDVYSMGVLLFILASGGHTPYFPRIPQGVVPGIATLAPYFMQAFREPVDKSLVGRASPQCQDLLFRMLALDERQRFTAWETLNHPWFLNVEQLSAYKLSQQQLQSLQRFATRNRLQKAVLLNIATQLDVKKVPELPKVFRQCDLNNDGTLSESELKLALTQLGCNQRDAAEAFVALDVDGDGRISYSEFVAGCIAYFDDRCDALLWDLFKRYDGRGKGVLTSQDIQALLRSVQMQETGLMNGQQYSIQSIVAELDKNHDGVIQFDEFRAYFMPQLQLRPPGAPPVMCTLLPGS